MPGNQPTAENKKVTSGHGKIRQPRTLFRSLQVTRVCPQIPVADSTLEIGHWRRDKPNRFLPCLSPFVYRLILHLFKVMGSHRLRSLETFFQNHRIFKQILHLFTMKNTKTFEMQGRFSIASSHRTQKKYKTTPVEILFPVSFAGRSVFLGETAVTMSLWMQLSRPSSRQGWI